MSSPDVVFSYLNNPSVTLVNPTNTIPSGGLTINFTGDNFHLVRQPILELYLSMGNTLVSLSWCIVLTIIIIMYYPYIYSRPTARYWTPTLLSAVWSHPLWVLKCLLLTTALSWIIPHRPRQRIYRSVSNQILPTSN